MNKQLDDILQKRMDRKDFLKHVGMGVAILTGTAGILKLLKPDAKQVNRGSSQLANTGYGASAYGGAHASRGVS